MLAISKFRQNFAKIWNFAKILPKSGISPGPSKFRHFLHFGENFASLVTLLAKWGEFHKTYIITLV